MPHSNLMNYITRQLEADITTLRGILDKAHQTIAAADHTPGCQFRTCTCRAADDFKVQRGEFYRQYNAVFRRDLAQDDL